MTLAEFDNWFSKRFRRTSSALTTTFFVLSDIVGVMLSIGWGFFLVRFYFIIFPDPVNINFRSFISYWPYLPFFIIIFQIMNLYPGVSLAPAEELKRFTIGSFLAHGGIILSRYVGDWVIVVERGTHFNVTIAFVISFLFSTIILLVMRSAMHLFLYKTKLGGIPAVIYGSGEIGRQVVDCLLNNIKTGYVPVVILDDDPNGINEYRDIPVIHDTSVGPEIASRYKIRMAILTLSKFDNENVNHLINYSLSAFRYNVFIPDFFNAANIWMSVRDFGGVLGFVSSNNLKLSLNLLIKRFLDIFIVILGGIIILPFLFLVSLIIKLNSPGPVLYKHKRLGKNGKYFYAYKFRSMAVNSGELLQKLLESDPDAKVEWEKNQKLQNDPRITGFGRIIRRTSIDEFPQLINILKGEMSLVGPRPIVDEEVEKYGKDYNRIFSITPGLTGLWQVSGRSNTNYRERVAYDTYYLQSWSVWLDLWILLKTFGAVIKGKGAY